jgi:hypothetical protein
LIQVRAQETVKQFWPELDTYLTLSPKYRLFFIAAQSIDRDSRKEITEIGPNLDITLKPILRMKVKALDPEKRKYLTFRVGYRYLISHIGSNENRMILEVTPRFPLPKLALVSDRSRIDLRWRDGFSWRYRNRLSVEKAFQIHSFVFSPYARGEVFYDNAAGRWNRTSYSAGVVLSLHKRVGLEPSFERQNITGSRIDHVNAVGLTLSLYL